MLGQESAHLGSNQFTNTQPAAGRNPSDPSVTNLKVDATEILKVMGRMEQFRIDAPGAVAPFTTKLQQEQNWSAAFTKLAIHEYQRFMILAATMPVEVTPSKIVDAVWHKHLTYTQSYWNDLCANVLQKEIDHHPGSGGTSDNKYQAQYRRTLALYEMVFNERAPEIIWPISAVEREAINRAVTGYKAKGETISSANRSSRDSGDSSTVIFDDPLYYRDSAPAAAPAARDHHPASAVETQESGGLWGSIKSFFGFGDTSSGSTNSLHSHSTNSHSHGYHDSGHHHDSGGHSHDGGGYDGGGGDAGGSSCGSSCGGGGCGGGGD